MSYYAMTLYHFYGEVLLRAVDLSGLKLIQFKGGTCLKFKRRYHLFVSRAIRHMLCLI